MTDRETEPARGNSSGAGIAALQALVILLGAGGVGAAIGRSSEHADARVQSVQVSGNQLRPLLELRQRVVNLTIDDEAHTFRFESVTPGGAPEVCTGSYDNNGENGSAEPTGSIDCTQSVPVS